MQKRPWKSRGACSLGGDGGIRTPVQNRVPAACYVCSRQFMCYDGLLPTGYRCSEPNCLWRPRFGGLGRRNLPE